MRKFALPLLLVLVFIASVSVFIACDDSSASQGTPDEPVLSQNNPYANPVFPIVDGERKNTYQADPYVVRDDDGTFYLYCTQTDVYTPELVFKRGPIFAINMVDKQKSKALFLMVNLLKKPRARRFVRLRGLNPWTSYVNSLDNKAYSGDYYMKVGINLSDVLDEFESRLVTLEEVE